MDWPTKLFQQTFVDCLLYAWPYPRLLGLIQYSQHPGRLLFSTPFPRKDRVISKVVGMPLAVQ